MLESVIGGILTLAATTALGVPFWIGHHHPEKYRPVANLFAVSILVLAFGHYLFRAGFDLGAQSAKRLISSDLDRSIATEVGGGLMTATTIVALAGFYWAAVEFYDWAHVAERRPSAAAPKGPRQGRAKPKADAEP